jgi:CRP/FNR family transcriptional regulator
MIDAGLEARLRQGFPVFQQLPEPLWARLRQEASGLAVPAGAAMFEPRSPCKAFPLLVEGCIRVSVVGGNGRELLLYKIEPGESCVVTSSCLLGNTPYPARGVVERAVSAVVLPPGLFNFLTEQSPVFRQFVFRLFAERLSELMQLVEEVAFRKLDQRLAALLLGKGDDIATTHQALADELGSVREIVSRLLKSFEDQGMVVLGRQSVKILDEKALRAMAGL